MKKLNKLQIKSEKLMNDIELRALNGGYGGACCWCYSTAGGGYHMLGASSPSNCNDLCRQVGYLGGRWDC